MKQFAYLILGLIIGYFAHIILTSNESIEMEASLIIKPKGVITSKEAIALDKNFDSRHELISDSIVGKKDNRSSWYSLEDIENYLKYTQHLSDSLGYKMDGIRIYLGSHEPKDFTTMFIVPTGLESGGMLPQKSSDLTDLGGLNGGTNGYPPSANYPQ